MYSMYLRAFETLIHMKRNISRKPVRIVDLSIAIESGLPSDPPAMIPNSSSSLLREDSSKLSPSRTRLAAVPSRKPGQSFFPGKD